MRYQSDDKHTSQNNLGFFIVSMFLFIYLNTSGMPILSEEAGSHISCHSYLTNSFSYCS